MDTSLPDWSTEVGFEFPVPSQRKPLGADNELVELLWQNGEVVLHSQTHRKSSCDSTKIKQVQKQDLSTSRASGNPSNFIQDDETMPWINFPIDETFAKEFCANILSEIPISGPVEAGNHFEGEKVFNFGEPDASHVNIVLPSSQQLDIGPIPLTPLRFETFDPTNQPQNLGGLQRTSDLQLPVRRQGINRPAHGENHEGSAMTRGSSHCGSNQIVNDADMSRSSCGIGSRNLSPGMEKNYARKVRPESESTEREQPITSCSGGSGSSLWKTSNQSNDTNRHKRKSRDVEDYECQSDATELESAAANKSSQKSGTTRRSRIAEVHNLSERRRRDRINEKMKALQELIPHSSKSDKASMLDEAIEYMKSLQLQLQLMWMGGGMAPMMLQGMQHYMSRIGMGIGAATLPQIQNIMRISRLPLVDQSINVPPQVPNHGTIGQTPTLGPVNYQNQMPSSSFHEQYANYIGFPSMRNDPQAINMLNFGSQSAQQNQGITPPRNGNASINR